MSYLPQITTANLHRKSFEVLVEEELVSALSPVHTPHFVVIAGGMDDFRSSRSTTDGTSPVSSPVSAQEEEEARLPVLHPTIDDTCLVAPHLMPLKATAVKCCRCDTVQRLLDEWNPSTGEHRAVCSTCTAAFCAQCEIEPAMNVILFKDGKAHLPQLPGSENRVQHKFTWFCKTCGRIEDIPRSQLRDSKSSTVVSVNQKAFNCEPCAQKASPACVFVATTFFPSTSIASSYDGLKESNSRPVSTVPMRDSLRSSMKLPEHTAQVEESPAKTARRSRAWTKSLGSLRRLTTIKGLSKQQTL